MTDSTSITITAMGAAAPTWRLHAADVAAAWGETAGRGSVAVCASDEDALTLAWTAATRALRAASWDPVDVEGLWWGSSSLPFGVGPSLGYLAASLGLSESLEGSLNAGGRLAGIDALNAAADAVATGRVRRALVVASDASVPGRGTAYERQAGAAAVAFLLTSDPGPASVTGRASAVRPFLDRYQGATEDVVRDVYDPRLFRERVFLPSLTSMAATMASEGAPDRWGLPSPDGRLGRILATEIGTAQTVGDEQRAALGDLGACDALLRMAAGVATSGTCVVLAQGDGRTVGVATSSSGDVPGHQDLDRLGQGQRDVSYPEVLRARGLLGADTDPIEMAVPVGGAGFVRGNIELLGLHGAKCSDCGTISTPPSVHPTCVGCGGSKMAEVVLERTGSVQTFVVNTTMPAPFEAPLPMVVLDLDDGARLMVQGAGDAEAFAIGARVELVLRRYAIERGAPVYGFKALVTTEAGSATTTEAGSATTTEAGSATTTEAGSASTTQD